MSPSGRVPSRGSDQFMLRLPQGMRDRLKDAADENGRSMNSEIVSRLERTFAIDQANQRARERVARGEPPEEVPPPTDDDYPTLEPADVETLALAAQISGDTTAFMLEQIVEQLTELRKENQLLREEVSALHKQLPRDGS